jgi:hypothetical protein
MKKQLLPGTRKEQNYFFEAAYTVQFTSDFNLFFCLGFCLEHILKRNL